MLSEKQSWVAVSTRQLQAQLWLPSSRCRCRPRSPTQPAAGCAAPHPLLLLCPQPCRCDPPGSDQELKSPNPISSGSQKQSLGSFTPVHLHADRSAPLYTGAPAVPDLLASPVCTAAEQPLCFAISANRPHSQALLPFPNNLRALCLTALPVRRLGNLCRVLCASRPPPTDLLLLVLYTNLPTTLTSCSTFFSFNSIGQKLFCSYGKILPCNHRKSLKET